MAPAVAEGDELDGVDDASPARIRLIARAADLLRALQRHPEGASLAQLAAHVGLARSTVHRLVTALQVEGFVSRTTRHGSVRLGPLISELAAAEGTDLRVTLRPLLTGLAEHVGETVDLAVLVGNDVRAIDQVPGTQRLRAVSAVGEAFPAHCTANGKALLSTLPLELLEDLLPRPLPSRTPNTIVSWAALSADLEDVRRRGVAFDREEHALGVSAVGAVVRDASHPVAAITIVAPAGRFADNEALFTAALINTCRQCSIALGSRLP